MLKSFTKRDAQRTKLNSAAPLFSAVIFFSVSHTESFFGSDQIVAKNIREKEVSNSHLVEVLVAM